MCLPLSRGEILCDAADSGGWNIRRDVRFGDDASRLSVVSLTKTKNTAHAYPDPLVANLLLWPSKQEIPWFCLPGDSHIQDYSRLESSDFESMVICIQERP